jgi:hypothetical protein
MKFMTFLKAIGGVLLMEMYVWLSLVLLGVVVGVIAVTYVGLALLSHFEARVSKRNSYGREKDLQEH